MSNKNRNFSRQMERKKKEEKEKAFKEKVVIEFYKRNPEIFLERELKIKLSWLQKKLLHLFFRGKLRPFEESTEQ